MRYSGVYIYKNEKKTKEIYKGIKIDPGKRCSRPRPAQCLSAKSLTWNYRRDKRIENNNIKEWLDPNPGHDNVLVFLCLVRLKKDRVCLNLNFGTRQPRLPIPHFPDRDMLWPGKYTACKRKSMLLFQGFIKLCSIYIQYSRFLYVAMFSHGHLKREDRINQTKSQIIRQGIDNQNAR